MAKKFEFYKFTIIITNYIENAKMKRILVLYGFISIFMHESMKHNVHSTVYISLYNKVQKLKMFLALMANLGIVL